jgi:catechol 2,3-dioxygenase-like lactoylglutathione lyase family enzyme
MTQRFKVGFHFYQEHTTVPQLRAVWREVDSLGVDSIWPLDHFFPINGDPNGAAFDGWTLLVAMAIDTQHAHLGVMVATGPGPAVAPEQTAGGGPGGPASLRLASAVMFVTELERSVGFYQELLGWDVTLRDDAVALLVSRDGFQLYLRSRPTNTQHPLGQVGIQYLMWTAPDEDELHRCERVLQAQATRVTTRTEDGLTVVEGRDLDDVPILVAFPGPGQAPRQEIMQRIYQW